MPIRSVVRRGDRSTGHTIGSCSWAPTSLTQMVTSKTYANGLLIGTAQADNFFEHRGVPCKVWHRPPTRQIATGSRSVYVEGRPIGRVGDRITCGDFVAQGSRNVFAGG